MTFQQLEQRLSDLERQVSGLQHQAQILRSFSNVQDTFGMYANDSDFDEIVRLGRDYREQANSDGGKC